MKQKLNNLVQFLNSLEKDLNEHTNPHCHLTLLTHEGDPSVTYKLNTKLLRMAIRLSRRHYVKNREKDTYYPPGMHPMEIRERESAENKKYAREPVYIPADVKTISYLDEPERIAAVKNGEEILKAEEIKRAEELKKTSERWKKFKLKTTAESIRKNKSETARNAKTEVIEHAGVD